MTEEGFLNNLTPLQLLHSATASAFAFAVLVTSASAVAFAAFFLHQTARKKKKKKKLHGFRLEEDRDALQPHSTCLSIFPSLAIPVPSLSVLRGLRQFCNRARRRSGWSLRSAVLLAALWIDELAESAYFSDNDAATD
jgi:hypothetical protein